MKMVNKPRVFIITLILLMLYIAALKGTVFGQPLFFLTAICFGIFIIWLYWDFNPGQTTLKSLIMAAAAITGASAGLLLAIYINPQPQNFLFGSKTDIFIISCLGIVNMIPGIRTKWEMKKISELAAQASRATGNKRMGFLQKIIERWSFLKDKEPPFWRKEDITELKDTIKNNPHLKNSDAELLGNELSEISGK